MKPQLNARFLGNFWGLWRDRRSWSTLSERNAAEHEKTVKLSTLVECARASWRALQWRNHAHSFWCWLAKAFPLSFEVFSRSIFMNRSVGWLWAVFLSSPSRSAAVGGPFSLSSRLLLCWIHDQRNWRGQRATGSEIQILEVLIGWIFKLIVQRT